MREELDSFQEVFAHADGTWEALPQEFVKKESTFEELLTVNENKLETAENKRKNKEKSPIGMLQNRLKDKKFPGFKPMKWFDRNVKKTLEFFD